MEKQHHELRENERINLALPVDMGKAKGITRDISAKGIYFETDAEYSPGSPIVFTLELDTTAGRLQFKCQGEIVRVEQRNTRVGVAVKIIESVLKYK